MANFGSESSGASYAISSANSATGFKFTNNTVSGEIDSITAYLLSNSISRNMKAFITDASGNILTNGITNSMLVTTTPGWVVFTFSTKPSVSTSTQYFLWVVSETSYISINQTAMIGGEGRVSDSSNSYSSPTSPTDFTTPDVDSIGAIYATGSSSPVTRRIFMIT